MLSCFDGWYKDAALTEPWDFDTDAISGSITLYAKWVRVSYQVTFNPNGGTGRMDPQVFTPGQSDSLNVNDEYITREDYIFISWNTAADRSGTEYMQGQNVTLDDSDLTLYAQWYADYSVGDIGPAGGLIFYKKQLPIFSYPEWMYLEAAPSSAEPDKLAWAFNKFNIQDAKKESIGDGRANTTAIVEKIGEPSDSTYAAYYCDTYQSANDFSDWFLPSKQELARMCQVLHYNGLGNFENGSNVYYWSSTQGFNSPSTITGEERAFVVRFGREDHDTKNLTAIQTATTWTKGSKTYVRPIRAF